MQTMQNPSMIDWLPLGDGAWISTVLDGGTASCLSLAAAIRAAAIPGVLDVTHGYRHVAVYFRPDQGVAIREALRGISFDETAGQAAAREIIIPVRFGGSDGPDLRDVAAFLGLSGGALIRALTENSFSVAAIGFSPGFPYLTGLPENWQVPRRTSPRPVPAGSLAIAGNQLGIYPNDSPGGWHLLGRTFLRLFDPASATPTLLKPGDMVRFEAVHESSPPCIAVDSESRVGGIEVLEPGPLSSIQDLGRTGYRHVGITQGGAVDPVSARIVNRLVGNPDEHAVLECCMAGPLLLFPAGGTVAWLGWNGMDEGRPLRVGAGETLDLRGPTRSLRGYLAVCGGIDAPVLLGSRATDLRAGFGGITGRTLRRGDILPLGSSKELHPPSRGAWRIASPVHHAAGSVLEIRVLPGVQTDWFPEESREAFYGSLFRPSARSDRMGVRLDGPKLGRSDACELVSQPVAAGSIQVPPDGIPIVLMPECQTLGGYPQFAHVIQADLPKLANIWPGTPVRFREITLTQARAAWDLQRKHLALMRTGLRFLTNS